MHKIKVSKPKIKEKKLGREKALGQCFSDGLIEIDPRQDSKEYLFTLIHECCHYHFPELTEEQVVKIENSIGQVIWDKNYRRIMD
jgi:hypothetical protein